MKTIYLSGAIDGISDEEIHGWREHARKLLWSWFKISDPSTPLKVGQPDADIVACDLIEIENSDIILVRAHKPSWGTAMEIFYAHRAGKRVIVFGVEDKDKMSFWLRHHSHEVYRTLDEAASHIINGR